MKASIIVLLAFLFGSITWAQELVAPSIPYENMVGAKNRPLVFLEAGTVEHDACLALYDKAPRSQLIQHDAFALDYNGYHRVANWVYHEITAENLRKPTLKRSDDFRADPALVDQTPVNGRDYVRSGFDRGHLVPSGDFNWDRELNSQTFYMTNMAPQTVSLNQKAWESLERQVRSWACGLGQLAVYTGPIYDKDQIPHRLASCVSVPHRFFKIIKAKKDGKTQAIGFVYKQGDDRSQGETDQWKTKVMSIDEIEQLTGIDFFAGTDTADEQASFESQKGIVEWDGAGSDSCRATSAPTADPVNP